MLRREDSTAVICDAFARRKDRYVDDIVTG